MTEQRPDYQVHSKQGAPVRLPLRAVNLSRRMLQVEREMKGRGRVIVEIIFLDGEWMFMLAQPGELERLGE